MPVRKPRALIVRHETAAEKTERESREMAMRPNRDLPLSAPARLRGHEIAEATWRRLMREFMSLEGEIVTRLDFDLLVDYCILTEQVHELDAMRKAAYDRWVSLQIEQASEETLVEAYDVVVKLDSRTDRKRALLLQIRQSLYLTPRARAGVAPAKKEPDEPKDELEKLLDDVSDFVNGTT
ncbi:hypothetical protein BECAL_02948 [Bellilinea caldifistulae]|uniref:P27 family phage terminase small subunit n=1 Tax=Bellilinea caldifistulae TaxID=360411 RepID=A0A0P6XZF8_9CHLR|nr:hypothetical protein [Bellilinea caldifistulae]KPL74544.1 hypothetical protein AC812_12170 [Bellilinea caldifistulae]GAP11755.1 hypothetical protein BECAL_02948 [Bellilinea caldifistulae]